VLVVVVVVCELLFLSVCPRPQILPFQTASQPIFPHPPQPLHFLPQAHSVRLPNQIPNPAHGSSAIRTPNAECSSGAPQPCVPTWPGSSIPASLGLASPPFASPPRGKPRVGAAAATGGSSKGKGRGWLYAILPVLLAYPRPVLYSDEPSIDSTYAHAIPSLGRRLAPRPRITTCARVPPAAVVPSTERASERLGYCTVPGGGTACPVQPTRPPRLGCRTVVTTGRPLNLVPYRARTVPVETNPCYTAILCIFSRTN
jgi:hypothetical protein